jgi:hypothetical protein
MLTGCGESDSQSPAKDIPGAVENLEAVGWAHSELLLRWEDPVLGSPRVDGYNVYFDPIGATDKALIGTTAATSMVHVPFDGEQVAWVTGLYSVRAYNDEGEGEAKSLSTIPVSTYCNLHELDYDLAHVPTKPAGIFFSRPGGSAITVPVNYTYYSNNAEFYVTDFAEGCCSSGGIHLCSMAYGSYQSLDKERISDFAGELEECQFRDTGAQDFPTLVHGVTDGGFETSIPLSGNYFVIHTHDDHYAVLQVVGDLDPTGELVPVRCWFQTIPSFGVLAH